MVKLLDKAGRPPVPFALKIAFFNAFMLFIVMWSDCRMSLLRPAGQTLPVPPFGFWVLLWATALFVVNLISLTQSNRVRRIVEPFLWTAACGILISVVYYKWPRQHMHQIISFSLFPVAGLIATYVQSAAPLETGLIHDLNVPFNARMERIKQGAAFWMTLTISGGAAFLTFVYFWMNYMSGRVAVEIKDAGHQDEARGLYAIQIATYSVYFVLGPIYEGFAKVRATNRLLLDLRDKDGGHKNGATSERGR